MILAPKPFNAPKARPRADRRSPAASLAEVAIIAAGAAAYGALALSAHHDFTQPLNRRVRRRVRRAMRRDPGATHVAHAITTLSESAIHPLLGYAASRATSRLTGRTTWAPLIASLAVFAANKGTRLVVHQARPKGAKPRRGLERRGYPSGHTLAATAIALTTALELAEGRRPLTHAALYSAAAAYAGAMAWTRVALDEHWVDDVLGALAGGTALALFVHRTARRRRSVNYTTINAATGRAGCARGSD